MCEAQLHPLFAPSRIARLAIGIARDPQHVAAKPLLDLDPLDRVSADPRVDEPAVEALGSVDLVLAEHQPCFRKSELIVEVRHGVAADAPDTEASLDHRTHRRRQLGWLIGELLDQLTIIRICFMLLNHWSLLRVTG